MKAEQTITKNKLKHIEIIYNDDVQIIDFLADLKDREPIHSLQRLVDFGNRQPITLLYNCAMDSIVVVILYKAPFELNKGDNKLMLYADNNLRGLCGYFRRWMDMTPESNKVFCKALDEIVHLLFYQLHKWSLYHDKNTQSDFIG
jgi:hypothetical protein